jgi:hypothetical protein
LFLFQDGDLFGGGSELGLFLEKLGLELLQGLFGGGVLRLQGEQLGLQAAVLGLEGGQLCEQLAVRLAQLLELLQFLL